ncbi:SMC domain protein [Anaeromyxobacter dehalogenans 2CP-1]|uniref:SMC domain protein n=1 Tax=Anaeromyxobacter dehalogenans (strain ATCC BAA-258 / DSM 21875 / 2CP-1) TaxID=455488 RepID=B8JF94_ANAD2|nr:AAA family ATPase [Anaeromyxobacter dehalogenans]ACL64451.1 SMC domain protein [Anaeromyxobacter dehalogenans 2CP-1]
MIARLKRLSIKGFRRFEVEATVPLDADVILVHGPNGTGKSSVLNAIEFGLTGHVRDLELYRADYPRSLRNVKADAGEVGLSWADSKGEVYSSRLHVGSDNLVKGVPAVAGEDARFFQERCYLSQPRLTRLLETYQTPSEEDDEAPLVRFVRELLRLDVTSNLVDGLNDALDIRRLRKRSTALARLDANEKDVQQQLDVAGPALKAAEARAIELRARVAEKLGAAAALGDAFTADEEPARLRDQLGVLIAAAREEYNVVQSVRARVAGTVSSAAVSVPAMSADLPARLAEASSALKAVDAELTRAVDESVRSAALAGVSAALLPGESDPSARVRGVHEAISQAVSRVRVVDATRAELRGRIDVIEQRKRAINSARQEAVIVDQQAAASRKDLLSLLQRALPHVETSNHCPVCARDYGELERGSLAEGVRRQIGLLGGMTAADDAALRQERALRAEGDQLDRELSALRVQYDKLGAALLPETHAALQSAAERIDAAVALVERRAALVRGQAVLLNEQARANTLSLRQEWTVSEIARLANELGMAAPAEATLDAVGLVIEERSRVAKLREGQLLSALASVGELEAAQEAHVRARRSAERATAQANAVAVARKRVQKTVGQVKAVFDAAKETTKELVAHVFSAELNAIWVELFSRLAPSEVFAPRLSAPEIERRNIVVSAQAVADGVTPFAQLASVLSAGNLNTAALSLFLALHLVERPKMRVLLLDDPVQSMDDVHVIQLSALLRALVRQQHRQIVLAVHERALYDFLYSELGPSREGLKLVGIELSHATDPWRVTVSESRQEYVADGLPL